MSGLSFMKGQLFVTLPVPETDFSNTTIIVTGANVGLGFDCCRYLLRLGVKHLIMACRSVSKGEAAKQRLLNEFPATLATIDIWTLDLARYDSVIAFAKQCDTLDRLDGVVENAGVIPAEFTMAEKDELTITVNVVSAFLMAILLLPKMRETATRFGILPHFSIVGSFVHALANTKELTAPPSGKIFESLNAAKNVKMADRYNTSKLLVMLCVRELATIISSAEKHAGKPLVVVNAAAPGFAKTELFRTEYENWSFGRRAFYNAAGRSSEEASRALVHGVSAGRVSHGQYLSECTVKQTSSFVRSTLGGQTQTRVWDELIAKLEKIYPGITELI
jgi:retinol dehydrogenase 12